MKLKNYLWLISMALFVGLSLTLTACDDKNEPDEVIQETKVTVTNNSAYTLYRFRVVFVNSKLEELTDRDFGTLDPGSTITADIPTSAKDFYMATYLNSKWFFSPNYEVTYKNLSLSTAEIDNWSANSYANRYPKASSAN